MKKTFLARRNALLSPAGLSTGGIALGVVLALLVVRVFLPDIFLKITAPLFELGSVIDTHVSSLVSGFKNTQTLAAQNAALQAQNAALAFENRTLVEKEASLTALLGSDTKPAPGIVAGVLARPPEAAYDTLIVDAGSGAGVTLGMEAFGEGGIPAGVVTAVTNSFSRVTLFSSPNEKISGWVGKNHLPVTVQGVGGGAFMATLPKSAAVALGDSVFVPGPGALLLGTVGDIVTDASSPSNSLQILPVLNPFSITWVELIDVGASFTRALTASSTTP